LTLRLRLLALRWRRLTLRLRHRHPRQRQQIDADRSCPEIQTLHAPALMEVELPKKSAESADVT
jgi:hypothetical protein